MRRIAAATALAVLAVAPSWAAAPELPRRQVDTQLVPAAGGTFAIGSGGSLQGALDAAHPGDTIVLAPGAIYEGPFTLPAKVGSGWIVVRSGAGGLPAPGQRVGPQHARLMPKLEARSGPVLVTAPGAHHWRFIGIEIRAGAGNTVSIRAWARALWRWLGGGEAFAASAFNDLTLVQFGGGRQSAGEVPHHLIVDRCYLHGDPQEGARRGIALNARDAAVIDSHFADFKAVGVDSQAILGWNGPGPFRIENNYLEGAGENVMFGGGTPSIAGLVPSDIEVRNNHFAKPLSWKRDAPGFEGTEWTVKNLFELKNARRVRVEGNLLEHSWAQAQDGFAVLLTVRTEDDAVPWAVVEDVTIAGNVIRRSAGGVNLMGIDDGSALRHGRAQRIAIRNNLFYEIGGEHWGTASRLFQLLDGTQDVVIEHNTAINAGTILFGEREPHRGFVFAGNIVVHNEYGVIGSGTGVGLPTLARYFPDAMFRRNVIVGGPAAAYPPGNYFPATLDAVGFADLRRGDYRLRRSSFYANEAGDGADIGANISTARAVPEAPWQVRRP